MDVDKFRSPSEPPKKSPKNLPIISGILAGFSLRFGFYSVIVDEQIDHLEQRYGVDYSFLGPNRMQITKANFKPANADFRMGPAPSLDKWASWQSTPTPIHQVCSEHASVMS